MNQYAHRPMPHGVKVSKFYSGQYYVAQWQRDELAALADDSIFDAVMFIDDNGEWLD